MAPGNSHFLTDQVGIQVTTSSESSKVIDAYVIGCQGAQLTDRPLVDYSRLRYVAQISIRIGQLERRRVFGHGNRQALTIFKPR